MKKLVLIIVVLLVSILNACAKDKSTDTQEFVNPIFNKPLHGYSKQTWNTQLYPNSISESPDNSSNPNTHIEKHNCKLLENEQDHVKFLCNVCYQDILIANKINCSIETILYKITDDGLIEKQSFDIHKQEPHSIEYLITKP